MAKNTKTKSSTKGNLKGVPAGKSAPAPPAPDLDLDTLLESKVLSTTARVNGQPRTIHFRSVPSGDVLDLMGLGTENITPKEARRIMEMLADSLVTPDGARLVTAEELLRVPMVTITDLANGILSYEDAGGNG